jgi:ATP-dependent helicase/nuclease subunit B
MDPFITQLAELCRAHPTRAKWVFVPAHAQGHTIGERLALGGTAWANLRFVTPFDIALQVAGPFLVARGIAPGGDEIGPALVLRLLRHLPAGVPTYFRLLADHYQMGEALWSALRELRQAGIAATTLPSGAFANAAKHAELRALLAAFEQWLVDAGRADSAAVYREAIERCGPGHAWLSAVKADDLLIELPAIIWAPVVREFLDSLPGKRVPAAVPAIPGLRVPRRLRQARCEEQEAGSPLASLMEPRQAGPRSHSAAAVEPGLQGLAIFRAGGKDAEIEEVFRRILHAEGGALPFDQVEIACASDDDVPLVWEKAQREGWPITVSSGIPVTLASPARASLAWCAWIEGGYLGADLRRLLQSGDIHLTRARRDDVDHLSATQAARLLVDAEVTWGKGTYTRALAAYSAAELAAAGDAEHDDRARARHLRNAGRAETLREWIEARLAGLPEAEDVDLQALVDRALAFLDECAVIRSELDAKATAAIRLALGDLKQICAHPAARAEQAAPRTESSHALHEALALIRAALGGVKVGADRARPGCLHVSRLARGGFAGRPRTFVVGLEEGQVFPALVEDSVLLDAERRLIHDALATSQDRVDEAVAAIVRRMAALPPAVCLSYSCRDLQENRETFPSWIVLQALRLARPGEHVAYATLGSWIGAPVTVVAPPERTLGEEGWWLSVAARAGTAVLAPLFAHFPHLEPGRLAAAARTSDLFTPYDGLAPTAGAALDPRGSSRAVSSTALEKLAKCPFAWFLEYGLDLDPIDEAERDEEGWLDAALRGIELHALYAALMRHLRERRERPDPRRHGEWLRARAESRLAELRKQLPPPSPDIFERERSELLRDLDLFLERESRRVGTGREPVAFEVGFGRAGGEEGGEPIGQAEPVEIRAGSIRFALAGRIDRIDRVGEGRYEVMDYKTGSFYRPKLKGTFRQGRMLQHALYGLAADQLLRQIDRKARVEAGSYDYPTARGGGETKHIARPSAHAIEQVLGALFETVRAGAFTRSPDDEECRFCLFGRACGAATKEQVKAKLENADNTTLEAFRTLRGIA